MVRGPEAWSVNTGSGGKIGVIGEIVERHEDLPYIPCNNVGGRYASDCGVIFVGPQIKGTFVAGIAFARNNALGVVGVAPAVRGDSVYVWAGCNYRFVCYTEDLIAGFDAFRWAGVRVIHYERFGVEYHLGEAVAVAQAWSAGIVIVAPAGINGGNAVVYPAGYQNVLGVSGVLQDKSFASTSPCLNGDGSRVRSNNGAHVDLSAPFFALSTVGQNAYQDETRGWCGTYIASAHVAGAAALLRSQNPSWTNQQVVDRLLATALDRGAAGRDDNFGYGIVDAAFALGIAPPPPPPPPLSGVTISGPSSVRPYDTCTWAASPTGGTAPFTYNWFVNNISVGENSNQLTYTAGSVSFTIAVDVTDATGQLVTASRAVSISTSANICAE
jgi:subtilisin family serine protease